VISGATIDVALPQVFPDGHVRAAEVRAFVRRAEALGFGGLWTTEIVFSAAAGLDGLELLAHAAALSRSARLGIAVLVLPSHDPVVLAKRLATLDCLSGGRLVVGVAVGSPRSAFAGGAVRPRDRPVLRLTEGLELMRALWAGGPVDHRGELWQVDGAEMAPTPVQRPHPPVWFGGGHPAALRRAVRLGDGWIGAGSSSTEDFTVQARFVREELERAGRDPERFPVSKRVYIAVAGDVPRARRRVEEYFAGVYGPLAPDDPARSVAVVGPPQHCAEQLDRLRAAGASHLLLHPVHDELEQLEALAELTGLGRAVAGAGT
jgi:probable F420-dependent oxidoreductase